MKLRRILLFVVVILLSLLIGSVLGRIAGLSLNPNSIAYQYVSTGYTLDLPVHLNLNVLLLDFYLGVDVNIFSVLGMILGGLLFYRLQ